jgi:histidinol-phosphate aminotransferase
MTIEPRDDIALMEGYHSPQTPVAIRLNTNESPYPPPPAWVDEVRGLIGSFAWHRYPDRRAIDLRTAIGAQHDVGPEQVFVANGSNEVLQTILLTYGGHGRWAALWEPTYALHAHIARLTGTGVVVGERGADFSVDLLDVKRVFHEARPGPSVAFLCSPNNPTGTVDSPEVVHAVLDQVRAADGLLVVDEAYGQFAPWSALAVVHEDAPLVVTRTFSKTWSMAAARLGYVVGPSWVIAELEKVALPYHLDALKQRIGLSALGYVDDMHARVAALVEQRGRVQAALTDLPVESWPSGANFILFRPVHVDGGQVWQQLLERSILVRNCASWPRIEGCLRVTIGTPDENEAFIAALREILT